MSLGNSSDWGRWPGDIISRLRQQTQLTYFYFFQNSYIVKVLYYYN